MKQRTIPYKRSRGRRTNYRARLKLLLSHEVRLIVRPSLKDVTVQLAQFASQGDAVKVTVRAASLRKHGWQFSAGNLPAAYLAGYWAGLQARKHKITKAVLDMGNSPSVKGCRVYAVVKGAKDAGLDVPCAPEVLPSDDRAHGKHIAGVQSKSAQQFSSYTEAKVKPQDIPAAVKQLKDKLAKE